MLTILLACATVSPNAAKGGDDEAVTMRELDVDSPSADTYRADASTPGPVIVACEYDGGGLFYGPSEDPRIAVVWSPEDAGYYKVSTSAEFVDCRIWAFK